MSVVVVKLNWDEPNDDSGVRLYNIYRNDKLYHQLNDLKYNIYDEEKPLEITYFISALTNNGEFIKSNSITIKTKDIEGFKAFNYTLNFSI